MKKLLTIMMLCGVVCSYAQNTPRYAASTRTWTFGNQTWSDAIRMPECNKSSFTESDDKPDCRSYTEEGKTWYYYNEVYVDVNKTKMCPSLWRVPTDEDFETLVRNTTAPILGNAWGYGGSTNFIFNFLHGRQAFAEYWSTIDPGGIECWLFYNDNDELEVNCEYDGYNGRQVRCVK